MESLVVFESMYGETRVIAEAVGAVPNGCAWDTQLLASGKLIRARRWAEPIAMATGATSGKAA
jgi:hypothetical protein